MRPLEVFSDLETNIALDFLKQYPTPQALSKLTRRQWNRFAQREHHLGEDRCKELWEKLNQPQLQVPEHMVRAKMRLMAVLVGQLEPLRAAVESYNERVKSFFNKSLSWVLVNPINLEMKLQAPRHRTVACFN